MTDNKPTILTERRKNPARRRAPVDVKYQILWNEERRGFDIYRAETKTEFFASDKTAAVSVAIRQAECEAPGLKVTVSALQNGKNTVEWSR